MIFAKRDDWLLKLEAIKADPNSQETVQIFPLDGLTREMIAEAMNAQGMTPTFDRYGAVTKWDYPDEVNRKLGRQQPVEFKPNWWIIHQHGNVIYVRRANY